MPAWPGLGARGGRAGPCDTAGDRRACAVTEAFARWGLLERMVKELPTGVAPRKELIAGYVADGRWEASKRQAREYQALYPEDRAYVESVLRSNPAK